MSRSLDQYGYLGRPDKPRPPKPPPEVAPVRDVEAEGKRYLAELTRLGCAGIIWEVLAILATGGQEADVRAAARDWVDECRVHGIEPRRAS